MEKANSRNLEKEAFTKLRKSLKEALLTNLLTSSGVDTKELDNKHMSKEITQDLAMDYIELLLEIAAYVGMDTTGRDGESSSSSSSTGRNNDAYSNVMLDREE